MKKILLSLLLFLFASSVQAQTTATWGIAAGSNPRGIDLLDESGTWVQVGTLDSTGHTIASLAATAVNATNLNSSTLTVTGVGAGTAANIECLTSAGLLINCTSAQVTGFVSTATASTLGVVDLSGATLTITSGGLAINLGNANTWTANQTFPNQSITLPKLASQGANTFLGAGVAGSPVALTINGGASCTTALTWTNGGTNLGCNASLVGTVTSVTPGIGVSGAQGSTSNTPITTSGTLYTDSSYQQGRINGLVLSNDVTTPNTVIDTAKGVATSDDATQQMKLGAFTKTIASTWTVGTGNGCLDTGTAASSTWYHVFVIMRVDTNVVDELCSTSLTPVMPTNYTVKRRIGSIMTDASTHILAFTQTSNEFIWSAAQASPQNGSANLGTTAVLFSLGVPPGVKVVAEFSTNFNNAAVAFGLMTSPDQADVAPGAVVGQINLIDDVAGLSGVGFFTLRTNTSQQVRARASAASSTLQIAAYGWIDSRGQDN